MSHRLFKSFANAISSHSEPSNLSEFVEEAYGELHRMAEIQFNSEQPGRTLQPTALVHETFLRLLKTGPKKYINRAHFFGIAARAMRRILVEGARRRASRKRGGGWERIPLEDVQVPTQERPDYLAIDSAMRRLRRFDGKLAHIMELRIFAGLTARETAEVLRMGESTVRNRWGLAEAWLRRELQKRPYD
jgi:RNA polymerase sigma factor (TIGR02999 family)